MSKTKYVILVGDGMGDLPIASLNGRTPLEAAETPVMDLLAQRGRLFRLQTVPPGFAPGSDVANLSLLGYNPVECYRGRAPLEAASLGVSLPDDAVAFRCNLVTLETFGRQQVRMLDYSAGHIDTASAGRLIAMLEKELGNHYCRFYPGLSYRHLLVWRRDYAGLQTVPPHDYSGQEVSELWRHYLQTPGLGEIIDRASKLLAAAPENKRREAAGQNPANAIWLWGEGTPPNMATLRQRFQVSGAMLAAVDLLKGIGICAGMEIIEVPGATDYLDSDYAATVSAALDALKRHDLVFVHIAAPDEASHRGDLASKLKAIADFDLEVVGPMLAGLQRGGEHFRLVVTMDHYTPLSLRTHVDLPVPFILFDSLRDARDPDWTAGFCRQKSAPGSSGSYSERQAQSALLLDNGYDFIKLLLGEDCSGPDFNKF